MMAAGEGKQAQLLRLVLRKAFEDVMESISFAELIGEKPGMKKKKVDRFNSTCKTELGQEFQGIVESLFRDEGMDQLLKSRQELIEEQKDMEGCTAWRPSGSVVDDMLSFNMNVITAKRKQATVMCEKAEREVETLFSQVQEARAKAIHHQKQLSAAEDQSKNLIEFINTQEEAHLRTACSLIIY
ncbi:uncharacterized protein LOC117642249 [Thrips palmi]|uniref:Uncharacterized protein LOC117642249 n=1 Tax=Thrips palmi TaxID=161013 RepID=A0A6P8YHN6_THRPL|nr:uncharacterized protein LOC117642249 [Thrips palmi]